MLQRVRSPMKSLLVTAAIAILRVWCAGAVSTLDSISVGFDLQYSYGTSAVGFPDGKHVGIARVNTTQEYRDAFRRLSLPASQHFAPPYDGLYEYWSDLARRTKRQARKALGLPASDDVAAIATLIRGLRAETERVLGVEIKTASASLSHLPAVSDEDLHDAFELVGLEYIQIIPQGNDGTCLIYEHQAALAGYGISLCSDPGVTWNCSSIPRGGAHFVVEYTKSSVHAYHERQLWAYADYAVHDGSLELGSDERYSYGHEDHYWEALRQKILGVLMRRAGEFPTTIILTGESSSDEVFQARLQWWLEEYIPSGVPPFLNEDPVFMQARGMAEFARRALFRPKPPMPCRRVPRFYADDSEEAVDHPQVMGEL